MAEGKPDKKQSRLGALFQSHRKLFILLIIAIIIMLLSLAYYLGTMATRGVTGDESGNGTGTGSADPNAVTIDQDYLNSLNIDPEAGQVVQDYFIHHCFLNLYFKAGQVEQEMPVWNDPGNNQSMVVKLYVQTGDDQATGQGVEQGTVAADEALKGDMLFTSGLIPPGMMLNSVTLTQELKAGNFKATVVTTPVDANGIPGNSVKSVVDLHVR